MSFLPGTCGKQRDPKKTKEQKGQLIEGKKRAVSCTDKHAEREGTLGLGHTFSVRYARPSSSRDLAVILLDRSKETHILIIFARFLKEFVFA